MRDHFIQTVGSGSEASGSGDNTVDVSSSGATHSASHGHFFNDSTTYLVTTSNVYHNTYSWSHTHAGFTENDVSYLPPYYALSFIMKS